MIVLPCSSMAHVIDRAVAFRFADPPFIAISVTPDSVTLYQHRRNDLGGDQTILVEVQKR